MTRNNVRCAHRYERFAYFGPGRAPLLCVRCAEASPHFCSWCQTQQAAALPGGLCPDCLKVATQPLLSAEDLRRITEGNLEMGRL